MKNKIIILAALIGLFASCKKLDIDNPNGGKNPSFATAKEGASYVYTGEMARISAMLTQQLRGSDIHYEPIYEKYILSDSKLTNPYNTAYRSGVALGIDENTYEGKLIAGLIYSVMIEYFDNAELYVGRGEDPSTLTYDDIHSLLSSIGGDYENAAIATNARVYLNQAKYSDALAEINKLTAGTSSNYGIEHAGSSTNMNEWPRFVSSRGGYLVTDTNIAGYGIKSGVDAEFIGGGKTMDYTWDSSVDIVLTSGDTVNVSTSNADTLVKVGYMSDDPRLTYYYQGPDDFNFFMARNSMINFIGDVETEFIKAEALLMTDDNTGAQTAYEHAIQLSMDEVGVTPTDATVYISIHGTLDSDKAKAHEQIMKEKYIALFGHPMVFVDYKRTKMPTLIEKTGNFPDKWHYYYQ